MTRLLDCDGNPVPVTEVVDIGERLAPADFWSRIPEAELVPGVAERSLWSYPLLRRHFFRVDVSAPARVHAFHSRLRVVAGTHGREGAGDDPARQLLIAGDIRHRPIVMMHPPATGTYSTRYYPRRTNDWLYEDFLPACAVSDDPRLHSRMGELLDFMEFSQYGGDGSNGFTSTYFPAEFATAQAAGLTCEWAGGWDYLFDWEWLDSYGYRWHLHEPDHHVNSQLAAVMVRAYELTGIRRYLDSAVSFVHNQMPRYGFHAGSWQGKRYYWTEYNPSGPENPTRDATDNIQALVAEAVAMVGFRTGDRRMLEFARGLIWHCVREWVTDGRWYYDSAENPLNGRKVISHDMAVLLPALAALPYLLRGGVPMDDELAVISEAYDFYLANFDESPMTDIHDGQLTKLPAGPDGVVTSFYTANRAVCEFEFSDQRPSPGEVRVSRLQPPGRAGEAWRVDPELDLVSAEDPDRGILIRRSLEPGDVLRISYSCEQPALTPSRITVVDGEGASRTVTATVPSADFPTHVTASNFADAAARLFCPE
jgi:hypothetical protein